jgi:acyl carrier protein
MRHSVNPTERLDATMRGTLGLPDDADVTRARYGHTDGWDSVGHMELMMGLEEAFGIRIDADDVFAMSDYAAVLRVLRERYGVEVGP